MLLIFVTNDWLNDKEILYDENNICRIQSTQKQHWYLYLCWLYAPHWLLGSRNGFKNHTRISLFIKRTCHWWVTWICKIVSWWNDANVGKSVIPSSSHNWNHENNTLALEKLIMKSICKIYSCILKGFVQKLLQLIQVVIHAMIWLWKFNVVIHDFVPIICLHQIILLA